MFDTNVFYNGIKHFIYNLEYSDWTITNNLFILNKKRVLPDIKTSHDPVVGIYMYSTYDPLTDNIKVANNVLQGSEEVGFVFPDIDCEIKDKNGFYDNEVGVTSLVGVIFNHPSGSHCAYSGRVAAYHAEKCVMFAANNGG